MNDEKFEHAINTHTAKARELGKFRAEMLKVRYNGKDD